MKYNCVPVVENGHRAGSRNPPVNRFFFFKMHTPQNGCTGCAVEQRAVKYEKSGGNCPSRDSHPVWEILRTQFAGLRAAACCSMHSEKTHRSYPFPKTPVRNSCKHLFSFFILGRPVLDLDMDTVWTLYHHLHGNAVRSIYQQSSLLLPIFSIGRMM